MIDGYIVILQMLGVKRTERVLPTGTSLTVVGEVVFASLIDLCSVALLLVDMSNVLFCLFLLFILTLYEQAIKDDVGTIRIQRPHKGPFYVSPKSIDQLILNLGKWAKQENSLEQSLSWLWSRGANSML